MEKLNDYLKVAEAAEFLGVSQTTIRKYAGKGIIPVHIHPGNGYRLFKRDDLEKFLRLVNKESSARCSSTSSK